MKRDIAVLGRFTAVFLVLMVVAGPMGLYAADKDAGKPSGKSALQASAAEKKGGVAVMPEGQNVEKLLYTLNETLQENRKIRQSMRDLQEAFEKVTLEKSDVAEQMRKVEKMAIQRNKETGQRIDELNAQLEKSKKEMEKLQVDNKASVEQKLEVENKVELISA